MKIRCRSPRTLSSTRRQSAASQSRTSPSGPFTSTVSNLPIGSGISNQLLLTGSPDPRQLPFGPGNTPVSDQLCGNHSAEGPIHGFPVSCRLSTVGVHFLGPPAPAGDLAAFLTVGLPAVDPPDPNGVVMLRMNKIRPGGQGAPFTPGTVVRSRPTTILRPAPAALPAASPYGPADTSHRRGSPSRGVIGGSLAFAHHPEMAGGHPGAGKRKPLPAGLLLARDHRMERRPLRLLPRASHPAVTRGARRGGDRPFAHWPGYYTFDISRTSKRCLPLSLMHPHVARSPLWPLAAPVRVGHHRGSSRPARSS